MQIPAQNDDLAEIVNKAIEDINNSGIERFPINDRRLSEFIGVSCPTISKVRNNQLYDSDVRTADDKEAMRTRGYRPSIEVLAKICIALGIPFLSCLLAANPEFLTYDAVSRMRGTIESRIIIVNEQLREKGFPELFN